MMRLHYLALGATLCCGLLSAADWPTDGANALRTNFQPDEHILSKDNVKGLQILWKLMAKSFVGPVMHFETSRASTLLAHPTSPTQRTVSDTTPLQRKHVVFVAFTGGRRSNSWNYIHTVT